MVYLLDSKYSGNVKNAKITTLQNYIYVKQLEAANTHLLKSVKNWEIFVIKCAHYKHCSNRRIKNDKIYLSVDNISFRKLGVTKSMHFCRLFRRSLKIVVYHILKLPKMTKKP